MLIAPALLALTMVGPAIAAGQVSRPLEARGRADNEAFALFDDCRPVALRGSEALSVTIWDQGPHPDDGPVRAASVREEIGITSQSVGAAIVGRLETWGLVADEPAELVRFLPPPFRTRMELRWVRHTLEAPWVPRVDLRLSYSKRLRDDFGNSRREDTWQTTRMPMESSSEGAIVRVLLEEVDGFATEYLRVNARACGSL